MSAETDAPKPRIELDWEEGLFKAVRGLLRKISRSRARAAYDPDSVALTKTHHKRLLVLAQLIAGHPVQLLSTSGTYGLRGDELLLPDFIDLKEPSASAEVLLMAACVMASAHGLGVATTGDETDGAQLALELRCAERAIANLCAELPRFEARFSAVAALVRAQRPALESLKGRARVIEAARQRALEGCWPDDHDALAATIDATARGRGHTPSPQVPLWGRPLSSDVRGSGGADKDEDEERPSSGEEYQAPVPVADVKRKVLEQEEEYNLLVHTFEKVETLDNHRGGFRDTDGSDELDDQLEALEDVELREVVRGGAPAEAILRAELSLAADIPDVEHVEPWERGVSYDEWDFRSGQYRRDWCTVYQVGARARNPAFGAEVAKRQRKLILELRRRIELHRTELEAEKRQSDGEEVDIDAVVRAAADWRAGESGDERLYISRRRLRRDCAMTVLLDVSLSTDAYIDNRRVLDVAREATVVLGEVADGLGDRFKILAFASKTRNVCRVFEVRGWGDAWEVGRARIGALEPQGYTRIGPALRHATADLAATHARRKLLVLMSDGKPTDYDRYEGRYGMADIRMALREARRLGIAARALTIDARARPYLSATFGPGQWDILPSPALLPKVLTEFYGRWSI